MTLQARNAGRGDGRREGNARGLHQGARLSFSGVRVWKIN